MKDPIRRHKKALQAHELSYIEDIKTLASELHKAINDPDVAMNGDKRCRDTALIRLEECIMWAVKGVSG